MYSKLFPPRSFNEVYQFEAKSRLHNKSLYFNQNTFLKYYNNKISDFSVVSVFVATSVVSRFKGENVQNSVFLQTNLL